ISTGPLTKSSVKFCESEETLQSSKCGSRHALLLFVDIPTVFFLYKGRFYTEEAPHKATPDVVASTSL
ncbi:hypothetical protein ILYODFUR_014137, partial [Ilyodon furcidens]